ncbi:hypothetical protein D3C80_1891380 [compost metagenome]
MRRDDELGQPGDAAILERHLGQGIDVVADQHATELCLETQTIPHEPPAQQPAIHRITEHQATMIPQYLGRRWQARARQVAR